MEGIKSHRMKMSEKSETAVPVKIEVKEEYYDELDCINFEEILPDRYEVQRHAKSSEVCDIVIAESTKNRCSPLRCRLCAIPSYDMVDILSSNAIVKNIALKIEHCLRIVVKESDQLPKQVCWLCLEKLEICYNFNEAVAEAENQLIAICRQTSATFEETENSCQTFSLRDEQRGIREYNYNEETLKTCSDMGMKYESINIPEEVQTANVTVKSNPVLPCLAPYSVELVSTKTNSEIKIIKYQRERSNDNEYQNADSPTDALNSGKTLATHIDPRSVCVSRVPKATRRRSQTTKKKIPNMARKMEIANGENSTPVRIKERCYKCNSCAKTFTNKYYMAQHNKHHTGKGLHSCKYCEKKFTNRTDRNRHQRIHTNVRPHKCPICEKMFTSSWALKGHTAVHSENRDYHCSFCDKSFKSMGTRNRHALIHTGEKRWQCDHCKSNFKRRDELQKHLTSCKEYIRAK